MQSRRQGSSSPCMPAKGYCSHAAHIYMSKWATNAIYKCHQRLSSLSHLIQCCVAETLLQASALRCPGLPSSAQPTLLFQWKPYPQIWQVENTLPPNPSSSSNNKFHPMNTCWVFITRVQILRFLLTEGGGHWFPIN